MHSRSRAASPLTRARTRAWRFSRARSLSCSCTTLRPSRRGARLARLAGLLLDHLVRVADAFPLVRLGHPQPADLRGHLSDLLPVGAGDRETRLLVDPDLDAVRNRELDRMGVPQRDLQLAPLDLRLVPDADDLQVPAEPLVDALHGIGDQSPRQTV